MESKTREKLRSWAKAIESLTEEQKKQEAEVWCAVALDILLEDKDFQQYLDSNLIAERGKLNAKVLLQSNTR